MEEEKQTNDIYHHFIYKKSGYIWVAYIKIEIKLTPIS